MLGPQPALKRSQALQPQFYDWVELTESCHRGAYGFWRGWDREEALEWVKRCPNPMPSPCTIEIRPIYEPEDLEGLANN